MSPFALPIRREIYPLDQFALLAERKLLTRAKCLPEVLLRRDQLLLDIGLHNRRRSGTPRYRNRTVCTGLIYSLRGESIGTYFNFEIAQHTETKTAR